MDLHKARRDPGFFMQCRVISRAYDDEMRGRGRTFELLYFLLPFQLSDNKSICCTSFPRTRESHNCKGRDNAGSNILWPSVL